MIIKNSILSDVPQIFEFYRIATSYMKTKNQVYWPEFSKELILNEIDENRQWKLLLNNQITCIWATTEQDDLIWGNCENEPSVYIHRIAIHPDFRGQNFVKHIIDWANEYGKNKNLKYIRLDTVGLNEGLITHYTKLGFDFLGMKKLVKTTGLPDHYNDGEVCLFQKKII